MSSNLPDNNSPTGLRVAAVRSARWVGVAQVVRQVLALLTNLWLARLLLPDDFGLAAVMAVSITFVDLLQDMGTTAALVQRKQVNDRLLSSAFWLNTGLGVVAGVAALLMAPLVGGLLGESRVVPILQVTSLLFVLGGLRIVPRAILTRDLHFAPIAKIELAGTVLGAITAIALAVSGAGVWALVAQAFVGTALLAVLFLRATSWRPQWIFDRQSIREIRSFSLYLTAFQILNYFHEQGDYLLIGYALGTERLGVYWFGFRLSVMPVSGLSQVVSRVLFPYLSRLDDDLTIAKKSYLSVVTTIGLTMFPVILGFAAICDVFLAEVCGAEWADSAWVVLALTPAALGKCIATTTGSIYLARGRSDLMFRWGIYFNCIALTAFLIGLNWGIVGVAVAYAATLPLCWPNYSVPLGLIGVRMRDLFAAISKPLLLALTMFGVIVSMKRALAEQVSGVALLSILIVTGVLVYAALVRLFAWGQMRSILRLAR